MKKREVLFLRDNLKKLNLKGARVTYAISYNKSILEEQAKHIEEGKKPSDAFESLQAKLEDLKKYHAVKENGKPKIIQEKGKQPYYDIPDAQNPKGKFMKAVRKLEEEHSDVIKERNEQLKDYAKSLNDDIEIKFEKINLIDIPDDIIQQEMDIIRPFINKKKQ